MNSELHECELCGQLMFVEDATCENCNHDSEDNSEL